MKDIDALRMEIRRLKKSMERATVYIQQLEQAIEELVRGPRQTAEIVRLETPDRRPTGGRSGEAESEGEGEPEAAPLLFFPVIDRPDPKGKG